MKTSWIELFTAPFQFIAVLLNFRGGFASILSGISNYRKFSKFLRLLDRHTLTNEASASSTILRQKILSEVTLARHAIYVGCMCLVIAAGFVFLTMNSLHIIPPEYVFAGLVGQEICLVYFLIEMLNSCFKSISAQDEYQFLSLLLENLNDGDMTQAQLLSLLYDFGYHNNRMHLALTLIDPSFNSFTSNLDSFEHDISAELDKVDSFLKKITGTSDGAKNNRKELIQALRVRGRQLTDEFTLNLVYLLLNLAAGYGYMMGICTFYFPHTAATVPLWLRVVYLGLSPAQADWWGNFIGDLSWTIEPAILLFLAYYRQFAACKHPASVHGTKKVSSGSKDAKSASTSASSKSTTSAKQGSDAGLRKSARKKKVL